MKKAIRLFSWIACVGSAVSVMAGTITQQRDFNTMQSLRAALTFDRFGRSESLQAVSLILTIEMDEGYLFLDNDNDGSIAAEVELGFLISISSKSVSLLNDSLKAAIQDFRMTTGDMLKLEADDGDGWENVRTEGSDAVRYAGIAKVASAQGDIGNASLSTYIGAGTIDFSIILRPIFDFGDNSKVEGIMGIPEARGTLELIYTY